MDNIFMDVLLINAPTDLRSMAKGTAVPLGLAYLASFLKLNSINVSALDLSVDLEMCQVDRFKKYLLEHKSKIIGIGFTTHSCCEVLRIVKLIREVTPNTHITMGGHHVTNDPIDTLKQCDVDSVIVGDGEQVLYELCRSILDCGTNSNYRIPSINGLITNENNTTSERAEIKVLDTYPWPDRDLFNGEKYNLVFPPMVSVNASKIEYLVTSRGCPYACKFCSTYLTHGQRKVRYRSIKNVVDEISYLINERKVSGLFIYDDNFIINRHRIQEFANEMKQRRIFIPFLCYGRVNAVEYESFKLLRDVGLQVVSFGIESGSQRILKYLNKDITNEQTINAVKICKKLGILSKGTFIVGSPTEKIKDLKETLSLINTLKKIDKKFIANISAGGLFIYPGTGVYKDAINEGVLPAEFSFFKEYPQVRKSSNIPIYYNKQIKFLLEKAPSIIRHYELMHLFIHDPYEFFRKSFNKGKRLLKKIGSCKI